MTKIPHHAFAHLTSTPRIELFRLENPLARRFYDLARELDKLPADTRQSQILCRLDRIRWDTQVLLDDPDYRTAVVSRPSDPDADRLAWAQGLIEQLPDDHDGRNSWLLNYGRGAEADALRSAWDAEALAHGREPTEGLPK